MCRVIFDTLVGRYSNGVPDLDAVLKSWSGESCQIARRGADSIFPNDPHLTLVISPQPEVVQALARQPGFRGRGPGRKRSAVFNPGTWEKKAS